MAAIFANLYDALREAGVADDRARRAAEELFEQTSDVGTLRTTLQTVKDDLGSVKVDIKVMREQDSAMRSDIAVLKWMIGFLIALAVSVAGKLFLGH